MRITRTSTGFRGATTEIASDELATQQKRLALCVCGEGLTIRQAAGIIATTQSTAYSYIQTLYNKFDASNIQQLTIEMWKRGIIKPLCALTLVITCSLQASNNDQDHARTQRPNQIRITRNLRRREEIEA